MIAGSAAAIKKSLQRLEAQQLIVSFVPEGSRSKEYKANLARGEVKDVPFGTYAGAGTASDGGQNEGDKSLCPPLMDGAVEIQLTDEAGTTLTVPTVSPSTSVGTTGIWATGTLFDIYTREDELDRDLEAGQRSEPLGYHETIARLQSKSDKPRVKPSQRKKKPKDAKNIHP